MDIRLIAATNRDLKKMVEEGKFREDLYYRLHVVSIRMPPLREHPEDIPLLCRHFLDQFNRENSTALAGFTPDALEAMTQYDWPGNVRELRNAVERMVVMARGDKLTLRDIPAPIRDAAAPRAGRGAPAALSLEHAERQMIVEALRATGDNRTLAAERLGISRRTLHRKLNEYGLRGDGKQ